RVDDEVYVHPLTVWERHSPTMSFPHRVRPDEAVPVTSSVELARLFSRVLRQKDRLDPWHVAFDRAREALDEPADGHRRVAGGLVGVVRGGSGGMRRLAESDLALAGILLVGGRMIGAGPIGGKGAGMLVARAVLETGGDDAVVGAVELHGSFYVGSVVFY